MLFLNTDRQRWQRKYSVWLLREASSMRTCRCFCVKGHENRHEQNHRRNCTQKKPARGKSGSTPAPGSVEQRRACCRRTTETFACGGRGAGWAADSRCRCRFPGKSAPSACTGASTLCSRGRGAWHEFVQACRGTEASQFNFFLAPPVNLLYQNYFGWGAYLCTEKHCTYECCFSNIFCIKCILTTPRIMHKFQAP